MTIESNQRLLRMHFGFEAVFGGSKEGVAKVHFIHKDRTTLSKSEIHRPRLLNVLGGAEEEQRGWEIG
jgi:hypothetical protein